jgi:hypothetical protein
MQALVVLAVLLVAGLAAATAACAAAPGSHTGPRQPHQLPASGGRQVNSSRSRARSPGLLLAIMWPVAISR